MPVDPGQQLGVAHWEFNCLDIRQLILPGNFIELYYIMLPSK
jgi:hypothetical protein